MLKILKNYAYAIYARYFSHATLIEGTLKGSTSSCRCLMVMVANSPFQNYLLQRMYEESFTRVRTRRIWIPWLKRFVMNPPADVDFCIASLPARWDHSFRQLCDLKSPAIVRQVLDLTGDWPDIKKRFNTNVKRIFSRLMTENSFNIRISRDLLDFDHFYHRMYVPHCKKQFQSFARIDSYEHMKPYFLRGFLLILTENDNDIAGSLCFVKRDTMVYHRGGVLDGNEEYIKRGCQSALYMHKIRYAKDQKLAQLDLGHSRAFFDDGVYHHKRAWGASVSVDDDLEFWMYLFNPKDSAQVTAMLQRNPMIVHTQDGLMGYYVSTKNTGYSDLERRDLARYYYAPGLEGMLVLSPGANSPLPFTFKSLNDSKE